MSPPKQDPEKAEAQRTALIESARRIIRRDGASALTMRALAVEAGCALGLPYKHFADREELVVEIVHSELERLRAAGEDLVSRAGTATVGGNLAWYAEVMLDSPAVALAREVISDHGLSKALAARAHHAGAGPDVFATSFSRYLIAEQRAGRVDADVDVAAFAFLLAGALHNLIVSGEAYPRPNRRGLRQILGAIADRL